MKYLSILLIVFAFSGFSQSVSSFPPNQKIMDPVLESLGPENRNYSDVSRGSNISRWVSFYDAYTTYYASTAGLTRMPNGAIVNGANVHVSYLSGSTTMVDTAFVYGAYSLIDLDGTWNRNTAFDPLIQPFDPNEPITLDSIAVGFVYVKHDFSTIDTAVVRVAVPSSTPNQMGSIFRYNPPNNTASGDTAFWLGVRYNDVAKKLVNTVVEVKIPLTNTLLSNRNNWRGTDSTSFYVDAFVGQAITGHNGLLAIEVNVIHGKQLTSADTVGVNANWFSPLYLTMDPSGSGAPFYDKDDYTCGGTLYGTSYFGTATNKIFLSHWFGNSDNQVATSGARDPYQSAWVELKIFQRWSWGSITEFNNFGAKLFQNYPNPSYNVTTVKYELENSASVTFEILDITGKRVMSINQGNKSAGNHLTEINTTELKTGIYFYSIVVDGNRIVRKMMVN